MNFSKTKIGGVILTVIVIILLLMLTGWGAKLGQGLSWLISPVQRIFFGWGNNFTSYSHWQSLVQENLQLKNEVAKLGLDYVKYNDLQAENISLRNELNFLSQKKYQYEMVNVLGREPFNYQMLIIDKGSSSGLAEGMPATTNQGIIVGKIAQVQPDRAYVALLSDTKSNLAVGFDKFAGTNGLLKGQAGSSMIISNIPQDQNIQLDDLVITSGLEELVPRGLLVGRVSKADIIIGQVFKEARVTPLISYESLPVLTIIK